MFTHMTRKEQIINTAIDLFATEGYENTSIQKLADKAGVAQGLLYRHFKNKQDLLAHLAEIGLKQVQDTLQPYSDSSLSFSQAFKEHISLTCRYLASNRYLWKVIHTARLSNILNNSGENNRLVKDVILKPVAAKLKASGYKDADMYAWYIFSLIDGVTSLYLVHPEIFPLSRLEQFLIDKIESYEH